MHIETKRLVLREMTEEDMIKVAEDFLTEYEGWMSAYGTSE